MAWTKFQILITVVMVVTGSINTLSTKWADQMESESRDGEKRHFVHPFLQACGMFVGEMLCLLAFKLFYCYFRMKQDGMQAEWHILSGNQNFSPFIFLPAAICDMTGTSIMYVGLTLTYASSFQMLRGSVIVFTGLLSVAFLNRTLKWREWIGIVIVIAGLVIVGLSDILNSNDDTHLGQNNIITGNLLIVMAQIIVATQMVYEEKFILKHNVPALQAVGWEGVFGFSVLAVLLIPFYYIKAPPPFSNNPRDALEDAIDGFIQLGNNGALICAFLGTVISIAFFNFAGVSVTKEISATTRMVLDGIRTLVIWVVSIGVGWQTFHWLQVVGFLLLTAGLCIYNNIIVVPFLQKIGVMKSQSTEVLSSPADESDTTYDIQ